MQWSVVGDGVRPPWWRTALYMPVVLLGMWFSTSFSPLGWAVQDGNGAEVLLAGTALLLAPAGVAALWWRHRFPFTLTLVAAGLSALLPVGNTLAFVALAALLGRRRGPAVWLTAAVVAITSTWVVIADSLAQPRGASMAKTMLGEIDGNPAEQVDVAVATVVAIIVIGFGLTVLSGLLVRWRREAAAATQAAHTERTTSTRLSDEVARRQERERIAREVHDVMGHRLSLLTLHAGALEAHAGGDPRLEQSARLVRESATTAMDDLRSLLAVLREPLDAEVAQVPLPKLAEMVQESLGAGQQVNSSIFIADAERADPTLSRAVYRIVQELLTNARKHAAGQPLTLRVEGSPTDGITIDARNPYTGGWAEGPGVPRGLAGITERAELLGGTMHHGLDENGAVFRVRVHLPWREA